MGRPWAARAILAGGFAAVVITASLGPPSRKLSTRSTQSQPGVYCIGDSTVDGCPAENPLKGPVTWAASYCISDGGRTTSQIPENSSDPNLPRLKACGCGREG